jgi:large subunit ribosomal protein L4
MKCDMISLDNAKIGDIDLEDAIFGAPVRADLMARVVAWQLAKRRAGTHMVKDRSLVSGTTKKAYRQKGTGRARHGSLRAPQFRKGGTVFGPVVRDHSHDLPKKIRKAGLKSALASKVAEGKLVVVESIRLEAPKTKDLVAKVKALG